jgi:hypothetical protein
MLLENLNIYKESPSSKNFKLIEESITNFVDLGEISKKV